MHLSVKHINDFVVDGSGLYKGWEIAEWNFLKPVGKGKISYLTRFKVLWSENGVYFLFDCEDKKLTCSMTRDFDKIYLEDVVEIFLWLDETQRLYFEYEISPLGVELPILVPNTEGRFMGWLPWQYEGDRKILSATSVVGGPKESKATVQGWRAEFFIPYTLFFGLNNCPPKNGAVWRANMYRIDYDESPCSHFAWCEKTGSNFHDYNNFGTLIFTA